MPTHSNVRNEWGTGPTEHVQLTISGRPLRFDFHYSADPGSVTGSQRDATLEARSLHGERKETPAAHSCTRIRSAPPNPVPRNAIGCILYTSDAADEEDSVDLGG